MKNRIVLSGIIITFVLTAFSFSVYAQKNGGIEYSEQQLDQMFPEIEGNIRFSKAKTDFGKVMNTDILYDTVRFINVSDMKLSLKESFGVTFLECEITPDSVGKGETGMIACKYDVSKINDFGNYYFTISLTSNDPEKPLKGHFAKFYIMEDFSYLTEDQKKNPPVIKMNKTVCEFKDTKQGEMVDCDFTISNAGTSDLILRKIIASCGCTTAKPQKDTLSPGESTILKASFNTKGYRGHQTKDITIFNNDPQDPMKVLKIEGNVIVKD